jgi:hypothetical protein
VQPSCRRTFAGQVPVLEVVRRNERMRFAVQVLRSRQSDTRNGPETHLK